MIKIKVRIFRQGNYQKMMDKIRKNKLNFFKGDKVEVEVKELSFKKIIKHYQIQMN